MKASETTPLSEHQGPYWGQFGGRYVPEALITALDELERVLRRVEHDEDLLGRGGLVDHVDGLLDGEEAGLNTGGSSHLHEVLAHGVRGDLVVGNEDEVGTQGGVPLGGNLTVDQSIVDTGEKDIGLCHCDPSFRIRVLAFTT